MNNPSAPSPNSPRDDEHTELTLLQGQVHMLEAEMESLRRRMKMLEARSGEPTASEPVAESSAPNKPELSNRAAPVNQASTPNLASPGNAAQSPAKKRRRRSSSLKSGTSNHPKRSSPPRKRSRSSRVQRQLLFGYSLVIGAALLAVLVLMIMNLFGSNQNLPGGRESNPAADTSGSDEINIEIETRPDLQELRDALESAE